jgi:hypothetical protein
MSAPPPGMLKAGEFAALLRRVAEAASVTGAELARMTGRLRDVGRAARFGQALELPPLEPWPARRVTGRPFDHELHLVTGELLGGAEAGARLPGSTGQEEDR